jgi:hypothetical protein
MTVLPCTLHDGCEVEICPHCGELAHHPAGQARCPVCTTPFTAGDGPADDDPWSGR